MTDRLQKLHELQELHRKKPDDKWVSRELHKLEAHLGAYGQAGNATPPPPVPEVDAISPEAVQKVEGYTQIELPDIMPPEWARHGQPEDGVRISNRRSFGCHMLQNLQETAEQWTQAPEKVARFYGGTFSPRVYLFAGRRMLDRWFLLPTAQLSDKLPPYTFAPPVAPYSNTEFDLWKKLFVKHHFNGHAILMGGYKRSHLDYHPIVLAGMAAYKHQIITVANHPQWIMPGLNSHYETADFKTAFFGSSIAQLMNMDIGILAKNEFYVPWEPYAEGRSLREYLHEREPSATKMLPNFQKDPELKTKG
jgi:hypothetical protein